jgi:8-oxo-dGTP diphosphatase
MSAEAKIDFYNNLPRKRSAVGVLIFKGHEILVLEPTYKPNWVVPGGVVERSESPLEAAKRECLEEIGVDVEIKEFLCADYKRGNEITGDAVHFLFLGVLPESANLKIDENEIKRLVWMKPQDALEKFDAHLATRVSCGLKAIQDKRSYYCEEGEIIF